MTRENTVGLTSHAAKKVPNAARIAAGQRLTALISLVSRPREPKGTRP
jgi:hypothetical protein